jgi:PEGA domain-containing protein
MPAVELAVPVVPSEPTLRALIQALAEPTLRTSALEELVQAGQPAVPLLVEGLAARQEAVQSGAFVALARIGVGVGTLRLRLRRWADVTVDGRPMGTTPLRALRLTAGTHTVELRHPGYVPLERTVTVGSGLTTELQLDLRAEAQPVAPR